MLAVYAEKTEFGRFSFKCGYDQAVFGRKALVVEDVLNTGGSAKKVAGAVRGAGGSMVGLAAPCNRGGVKASDISQSQRFVSLPDIPFEVQEATDCPHCQEGVPINSSIGKSGKSLSRT